MVSDIHQLLTAASRSIDRADAELLLAHAAGQTRAWVYAHSDDPLDDSAIRQTFERLLAARTAGQPMAYLLGEREFYGRAFKVTSEVLIPRPETELLVDLSLALDLPERARVVDVGTGSGCIALTLALERPDWQVAAVDISAGALAVALENSSRLGASRVALSRSDLLESLNGQVYDLIVSNPPYVAAHDPHLAQGDLRFEPELALSAGSNGLALVERLILHAGPLLASNGWLLIEHGHDQAAAVRSLLQCRGFVAIESWPDLAGIARVTGGRLPEP